MEPTNRDRAFRIAQIEPEYFSGICDIKEDFVTDLLTDIRHYCDANGINFAHRDTMAYQHYIEENGAQEEGQCSESSPSSSGPCSGSTPR